MINQLVVSIEGRVFTRRSELSIRCLYLGYLLYTKYVIFKHCLLVLPLFVAICEI